VVYHGIPQPGFLGTQAEFKRTFFMPIQTNRDPEAVDG